MPLENLQEGASPSALNGALGDVLYEQSYNADGTMTEVPSAPVSLLEKEIEQRVAARVGEVEEAREQTRFERDMARLRAKRGDVVQPLLIDDEEWFIKRFARCDLTEIGVLMARDGYTLFDIEEGEAQDAFFKALLYVGVVVGRDTPEQILEQCNNTERYFSTPDEAKELYDEPGFADVALLLCNQILNLNPYWSMKPKKGD